MTRKQVKKLQISLRMVGSFKILLVGLLVLVSNSLFAETLSRPTVIFVHGSPATGAQFHSFVNSHELRNEAFLVAPDRPGYGGEIQDKSFYDFADQVKSLLTHINAYPGRIILVGYSYGAIVAMKAAQIASQKIESLVLISGIYSPSYVADRWFNEPMTILLPSSEIMSRYYRQSYREIINTASDAAHTMKGLSQIKARMFVVHGENDSMTPAQSVNLLASLKPTVYIRKNLPHNLVKKDADFIKGLLLQIIRSKE